MSVIKNLIMVLLMVIVIAIISAGCSAVTPAASPSTTTVTSQPSTTASPVVINEVISAQAAYDMIQSNRNNTDFIIVDVRTQGEYSAGHVAGATMIDIYLPDFQSKVSALDRNKKYLVYCMTGIRSAQAVKTMKDLGFREVYDLGGGINQWTSSGYPLVTN